ncbi:MAG: hypothetical protein F6J93_35500 [Oscillatoria sp. SIO1A7]|nr:hypothetical protein [Oscillatoria sp. SIO1A7]
MVFQIAAGGAIGADRSAPNHAIAWLAKLKLAYPKSTLSLCAYFLSKFYLKLTN